MTGAGAKPSASICRLRRRCAPRGARRAHNDVRVLVLRDGDTVRVMSDAALELRGELPAAALAAS